MHMREKMTIEERLQVLLDIARALEYLHGQGFTHVDIKSLNVLIYEEVYDGDKKRYRAKICGTRNGCFNALELLRWRKKAVRPLRILRPHHSSVLCNWQNLIVPLNC